MLKSNKTLAIYNVKSTTILAENVHCSAPIDHKPCYCVILP